MTALAELQGRIAAALLADPDELPGSLFAAGPIRSAAALRVHRDTILGGLVHALRLTFPTVDRLVGDALFDHFASAFAKNHPPRQARLSDYGEGFPEFMEPFGPALDLAYLGDVARLDLAIDRTIAAPGDGQVVSLPIDASATIKTPRSLRVLALNHPADQIRDALDAGDDGSLAAIDLSPRACWLALWRTGDHASVRALSAPAAAFLDVLLSGQGADDALAAALALATSDQALSAIQTEVFAAPFALIIPNPPEGNRR